MESKLAKLVFSMVEYDWKLIGSAISYYINEATCPCGVTGATNCKKCKWDETIMRLGQILEATRS